MNFVMHTEPIWSAVSCNLNHWIESERALYYTVRSMAALLHTSVCCNEVYVGVANAAALYACTAVPCCLGLLNIVYVCPSQSDTWVSTYCSCMDWMHMPWLHIVQDCSSHTCRCIAITWVCGYIATAAVLNMCVTAPTLIKSSYDCSILLRGMI